MTTGTASQDPEPAAPTQPGPEVCETLDVSERWLRYRVAEGLTCHRYGRRLLRFDLAEVNEWLEAPGMRRTTARPTPSVPADPATVAPLGVAGRSPCGSHTAGRVSKQSPDDAPSASNAWARARRCERVVILRCETATSARGQVMECHARRVVAHAETSEWLRMVLRWASLPNRCAQAPFSCHIGSLQPFYGLFRQGRSIAFDH